MRKPILISILFISTIVFSIFFVFPKMEDSSVKKAKVEAKRAELQSWENYVSNLKSISKELESYQPQLAKIDSALPKGPEMPVLFVFFQKTSSLSGLVLKNITYSKSKNKERNELEETSFTLALAGSYPSLKNFLFILENSARLFEIKNISIDSSGQKEKKDKKDESMAFDLTVKTFSY